MIEHRMPIPARAYNAAVGGHVCGPEDIDFGQKVVHLIKYDKDENEVSFESQVTQANKIYVIHDDFVLSSNVTIPANCVLEFDGGSVSGAYTITGNNTGIEAGLVKIFNVDITLEGSWKVSDAYPEWFGAKAYARQYEDDCADAIQAIFSSPFTTIKFSKGFYYVSKTLNIIRGKYLNFNGNFSRAIIPYAGAAHAETTDNYGAVIWTNRDIDVLKLNIYNNELGAYDPTDFKIEGGTFDVTSVQGYSKTVLKFIRGRRAELYPNIKTTILGPNNYGVGTLCTGNAIEFCDPEDGIDNDGSIYGGYLGGVIVGFHTAVKNSITLNTYLNNVVFDFIIDAIVIAYDFGTAINTDGNIIYGSIQTRSYTEKILKGHTTHCLFDAAVWDFPGNPFETEGITKYSPKLGPRALTRFYELNGTELCLLTNPNVYCGNNAFAIPEKRNYIKGLDNKLYRTRKYYVTVNGESYNSVKLFNNYETFAIPNENYEDYTVVITIPNISSNFGSGNVSAFILTMPAGSQYDATFNNVLIECYNSNNEKIKEKLFTTLPSNSGAKTVGIFNTNLDKIVVTLSNPNKSGSTYVSAELNVENSIYTFDHLLYNDYTVGPTTNRPNRWDINNQIGFQYFDTTLGKPIYYAGNSTWVDATGTQV